MACSAESGEHLTNVSLQLRTLLHEHLPHQGVIHACVAMDEDVAERHDAGQVRDRRGKLLLDLREIVERSTADLNIASDW